MHFMPVYDVYAHLKYTYNIHHFAQADYADVKYTYIIHVQSYVYQPYIGMPMYNTWKLLTWVCPCQIYV